MVSISRAHIKNKSLTDYPTILLGGKSIMPNHSYTNQENEFLISKRLKIQWGNRKIS